MFRNILIALTLLSFTTSVFGQRIDVDKIRKLQKIKDEQAVVDEAVERKRAAEKLEQEKLREAIGLGRIRYCTILPFEFKKNQNLVDGIVLEVEKFLSKNTVCRFHTDMAIFEKMKEKSQGINFYLDQQKVRRIVADKLEIGSMFRVRFLERQDGSTKVVFKVIGENGRDYYYEEERIFFKLTEESVSKQIIAWIKEFDEALPFDAAVFQVFEDKVKFNRGKEIADYKNHIFIIKRLVKKKRTTENPDKVTGFITKDIARGTIIRVEDKETVGIVRSYKKLIQPGDWIKIEDFDYYGKEVADEYAPKLGHFELGGIVTQVSGIGNDFDGLSYGAFTAMKLNFPHQWYVYGYTERRFGSFSGSSFITAGSNTKLTDMNYKVLLGKTFAYEKWLRDIYISVYGGYSSYQHGFGSTALTGFKDVTMHGITLGVLGLLEMTNKINVFGRLELIPLPWLTIDPDNFGDPAYKYVYQFEGSIIFKMNRAWSIRGGFQYTLNMLKYEEPVLRRFKYNESLFKIGPIWSF